jgi:hypothetical protein
VAGETALDEDDVREAVWGPSGGAVRALTQALSKLRDVMEQAGVPFDFRLKRGKVYRSDRGQGLRKISGPRDHPETGTLLECRS